MELGAECLSLENELFAPRFGLGILDARYNKIKEWDPHPPHEERIRYLTPIAAAQEK